MNERVGQLSFPRPSDGQAQILKPYSEATAEMIDQEVCVYVGC